MYLLSLFFYSAHAHASLSPPTTTPPISSHVKKFLLTLKLLILLDKAHVIVIVDVIMASKWRNRALGYVSYTAVITSDKLINKARITVYL